MRWLHLKPSHLTTIRTLQRMKPAFVGSDLPKAEYAEVVEKVRRKEASFYQVKGQGVSLSFVGQVIDGEYHIIAMVGAGLLEGASAIIERVKAAGFGAITFHTYRRGMRRILNRVGFEQVSTVRDGNVLETRHRLELGEFNNG
ncbi:hypothetical protein [Enterovibrio norvegicus]|uniref:hypothetical protein n=1 Tax=Enterovibrio norvegicus TaxID=188144 RepID=UPI003550093D